MSAILPSLACLWPRVTLAALALSTSILAQSKPQKPDTSSRQDPPAIGDRRGPSRERMWRAPTETDWEKPVTIEWQRSLDDARAISEETGKPMLICVNMDGEIASEHYAGIRYRQPEVGELFRDYVCVIASTYRHNPKDHDHEGRRIPCPRFGGVTCGEHIALEPLVYAKYLDGVRVAPRHVMVEPDGKETFDVYYAFDTASVFDQIRDGVAERPKPEPVVRGDRTVIERVGSRHTQDRRAVEKAFTEGDRATRRQILEAAIANADKDPLGVIRLALRGFDEEEAALARTALAKTRSPDAAELIAEALASNNMAQAQRTELIDALARIGTQSARAKTLVIAQRGGVQSRTIDVEAWLAAGAGGAYGDRGGPGRAMARADAAVAELQQSSNPTARLTARLDQALSTLETAVDDTALRELAGGAGRKADNLRRLLMSDATRALEDAEGLIAGGTPIETLGVDAWKLDATRALIAYFRDGDPARAYSIAETVVPNVPNDGGWPAIACLGLLAEHRRAQITAAIRARADWPPEWLGDMDSAYQVIARHPLGTDRHIVTHYDFLVWMRAWRPAAQLLDLGLDRFPASAVLHDRLRTRALRDGTAGLLATYTNLRQQHPENANIVWFAGYADIVAAESHRRQLQHEQSTAAYDRAVASLRHSRTLDPATISEPAVDHYIAICMAGKARVAFAQRDLERAAAEIIAAIAYRPDTADALDGLNINAVGTAKLIRSACVEAEFDILVERLDAALASLRPEQRALPAFERGVAPQNPTPTQPGRRRGH